MTTVIDEHRTEVLESKKRDDCCRVLCRLEVFRDRCGGVIVVQSLSELRRNLGFRGDMNAKLFSSCIYHLQQGDLGPPNDRPKITLRRASNGPDEDEWRKDALPRTQLRITIL